MSFVIKGGLFREVGSINSVYKNKKGGKMNKKFTLLGLVIIALAWIIPIFTKPIMAEEATSIYQDSWIDYNKNGKIDVYEDPNSPIERRVKDLLSRMTLDEKIGQVLQLHLPVLHLPL